MATGWSIRTAKWPPSAKPPSYGTAAGTSLQGIVTGMAATPDDRGYWLVGSNGGVLAFGDASWYGSASKLRLAHRVVGMAATPNGRGYWLVASDGGIFAYGNARFYGSTGKFHLERPIVGIASTPDGHGYWLVASAGGIFAFGDAHFYGSAGDHPPGKEDRRHRTEFRRAGLFPGGQGRGRVCLWRRPLPGFPARKTHCHLRCRR